MTTNINGANERQSSETTAAAVPPAHGCCNSWFASLPEGRQAVLREDKWMLAHAAFDAGRAAAVAVPHGFRVTEEMHVAACKVLTRAHGLDGLPQRMLDAMFAAAPKAEPVPGPSINAHDQMCAYVDAAVGVPDAAIRGALNYIAAYDPDELSGFAPAKLEQRIRAIINQARTALAATPAAPAAVAGPSRDLYPEKCPITGRPFFMVLDHPELGPVPTYGGPFDSYTIPAPEGEPTDLWHERELRSERFDHDAGDWVEGGHPIPLRIVHDDVLFQLQSDAEASAPTTQAAPHLPERDATVPAEQQGLFRKFDVRRIDGTDRPGGKHHGCLYFVLDVDHDPCARAALTAYAVACEATHPALAADLRSKWGAVPATQAAPQQEPVWEGIKPAFFRCFGQNALAEWHGEQGSWFIQGYLAAHTAAPAATTSWSERPKALGIAATPPQKPSAI